MFCSFFAWMCFYELRTGVLFAKVQALFSPWAYQRATFTAMLHQWRATDFAAVVFFLGLAGATLLLEWLSVARRNEPYFYLRQPKSAIALVCLTLVLAPATNNGFIYFAF